MSDVPDELMEWAEPIFAADRLAMAREDEVLKEIDTLSEAEAEGVMFYHRWNDGPPVCPRCGHEDAYRTEARRAYDCKQCRHRFTVTSNTPLARHKLTFKQCLKVIALADEPDPSDKRVMEVVGVTLTGAAKIARTIQRVRDNSDMFWWKPNLPKSKQK